jgi:hypothetical protein
MMQSFGFAKKIVAGAIITGFSAPLRSRPPTGCSGRQSFPSVPASTAVSADHGKKRKSRQRLKPEHIRPTASLSFQVGNKTGIQYFRVIGDDGNIKMPCRGSNETIMKFGDIGNLGGGFQNFQAERLKLVILALHQFFGSQKVHIDPVFSNR